MVNEREALGQVGGICLLNICLIITGLASNYALWYAIAGVIDLIILIDAIRAIMSLPNDQRPATKKEHDKRNPTLPPTMPVRTPTKNTTRKREM